MDTVFIEASRESDVHAYLRRLTEALEQIAAAMQAQEAKTYTWTPEGLPICPKHGAVMRKREKQGDVWYSHRVIDPATAEELYCRGYHGKNSPGFDVDTAPTKDDDKPTFPRGGTPQGGGDARPRQAAASPAPRSELDGYFPRPTVTAPKPANSAAALNEFNKLATTVLGTLPAAELARCAELSKTNGGWFTALTALRHAAGIAEA